MTVYRTDDDAYFGIAIDGRRCDFLQRRCSGPSESPLSMTEETIISLCERVESLEEENAELREALERFGVVRK